MRPTRLSAATTSMLAAGTLLLAGPASAHVRVFPDTAAPGSYPTLTFRVPTESDTASTTKVEIDLPTDHPLGSVMSQPMPGWTATVTKTKLKTPVKTDDGTITEAPTKITWTASSGAAVKPGEFQNFVVVAGAVPASGTVSFAAHQTYSDGKVVDWNQPMQGTTEPEHPAPVLTVKDKTPDAAADAATSSASTAAAPASNSGDSTARWLGAGALVAALAGLLVAVRALTARHAK